MADEIVDEYKAGQRCRPPRKTWRPKFWQDVSLRGFSCTWITIINPNVWLDRILLSRAVRVRRSIPSLSHSSITPRHTHPPSHTPSLTHTPSASISLLFLLQEGWSKVGSRCPTNKPQETIFSNFESLSLFTSFFSSENSIRKRTNLWRTLLTR